jgi:hypothetical protein
MLWHPPGGKKKKRSAPALQPLQAFRVTKNIKDSSWKWCRQLERGHSIAPT